MTDELTQEQKDAAAVAEAAAAAEKAKKDTDDAAKAALAGGKDGDPYKDLSLPEGASEAFDPKALDKVKAFAATHKLSLEVAKGVIELAHSEVSDTVAVVGETVKKGGAVWKARVAELEAQALAAPDLGAGSPQKLETARLEAELHLNQEAPALKQVLEDAGLLAHPEVLRYLRARYVAGGEGQRLVKGDDRPPPTPPPSTRDRYNEDGSPKKAAAST